MSAAGTRPGAGEGGAGGSPEPEDGLPVARAGLCASCRHARTLRNRRGSTFLLCRRSRTDDGYERYPCLPVLRCPGWEEER